jgi:hypothetical protein
MYQYLWFEVYNKETTSILWPLDNKYIVNLPQYWFQLLIFRIKNISKLLEVSKSLY